jgi:hypothetical protein
MVFNQIATIAYVPSQHPISITDDSMIDKLYNVNQQRYKKYITMNETTNPHLNSQDNTVYYVKNESEHSKNSEDLYKNNTQRIKNK